MAEQVNAAAIWIFSGLDMFMDRHKNKANLFCELFEKKKLILELMQSNKIDASKYKKLLQKAQKQGNPELKKCAKSDLSQLGDGENDQQLNNWFELMVNSTGNFYQQQEKLYNSYKQASLPTVTQPLPPPAPQKQQQPSKNNFRVEQIMSLKVADNMLEAHEQNRELYQKIYEQKQRILSKNMTADKYKALLEKFQANTTNEQFKMDVKLELQNIQDFHDGNVEAWYQDILEESKENLQAQGKILANLKTGVKKSTVKKEKTGQSTVGQQKSAIKSAIKSTYNISQIHSLKIMDDQLEQCKTDLAKYKSILTKKKALLASQKKGSLTGQEYKKMLQTCIKNSKDEQMKQEVQFQLSQITEFHDGNIQAWFQDAISSATVFLEDQEEHLKKLEKGQIEIEPKEDVPASKDKAEETVQKPNQQAQGGPKVLLDFKHLYSLRALDQFMGKEDNKQIYCLCFERKQAIFEMIKKGQITPEKYKEYQETTINTTQNEQLKEIAEMDILNLTQLSNNNINEWFQDLINEAGELYQDQQAIYNKYKTGKPPAQNPPKAPQPKNQTVAITKIKITEKPLVNDVICITAIELLFSHAVETKDIVYYKDLSLKRQKLIELISQNRLTPQKYRQINKAAASKTQNTFLKTVILEEQKRLNIEFKNNDKQWFTNLSKKLQVAPPEIILPQNIEMKRLKYAPAHKKIEYLIKAMSTYQSLLYYYKKNKLPVEENRYLVDYEKQKRKETVHSFELIHLDKDFDVYNLALQMFPEITTDIFYGDNLQKYKQRTAGYIQILEKEIAALKEYSTGIKKSSNSQNIENAKKQTQKCKENIAYLKSWPNGLTGFPLIKEQKVEKYNMDVFNKLDKNDIEVSINNIEGLPSELVLNIYVVDMHKERYSTTVTNGTQTIKFTARVTQKQMTDISKGNNTYIIVRFFKRGFFGGLSLLYQAPIQTIFTRSNIIDQKLDISNVALRYTLKVQRPIRPIIKQITHVDMTIIPKYKHQKFVQEELIKKYLMYSNPTQSEIMSCQPGEE